MHLQQPVPATALSPHGPSFTTFFFLPFFGTTTLTGFGSIFSIPIGSSRTNLLNPCSLLGPLDACAACTSIQGFPFCMQPPPKSWRSRDACPPWPTSAQLSTAVQGLLHLPYWQPAWVLSDPPCPAERIYQLPPLWKLHHHCTAKADPSTTNKITWPMGIWAFTSIRAQTFT